MHGEVLHHLVRRGYEAMSTTDRQTIVDEASALEILPIVLTGALFAFILASVRGLKFK